MTEFYVCVLKRPWNNVPCYVGKGSGRRVNVHNTMRLNHFNKHLVAIFAKVGKALESEIVFRTTIEQDAFDEEVRLIAYYGKSPKGVLCNMTDGGEGVTGLRHTAKTKAKMSASKVGIPTGPFMAERYANISAGRAGIKTGPRSAETRAKISAANRTRIRAPMGPHSEEWKAKISASLKGRKHSDERKRAIAACVALAADKSSKAIKMLKKRQGTEGVQPPADG